MDRSLIVDFFEEYKNFQPEMIERELKIEISDRFITSIVGPRRVGKTYYLLFLRRFFKNPLYLNFEDSRLFDLTYKELRDVIRIFIENYGTPDTLLLDEIQNMKGWEIILRELHDLKKYKIIVTGSSSKLLSKEIATQLRGRTLTYLLLPFSFREFLRAKNFNQRVKTLDKTAELKKLLLEYLEYGGFPDVVFSEKKEKILKEYADLVLFRDFVERHKIENLEVARFLHNFVIQNFSKEISINSIYNKLKSLNVRISKDTVYKYMTKLEDTVFFFFLRRYSKRVHLRESWPKKIYLCDTGLSKVVKFSEDTGKLMENLVFLELLRKTNENPSLEVYYYRTKNNKEVDFLIKENGRVTNLINVSYISSFDELEKREYISLLEGYYEVKEHNPKLAIITWDYEDEKELSWFGKKGKIKFIPLWKWLLG